MVIRMAIRMIIKRVKQFYSCFQIVVYFYVDEMFNHKFLIPDWLQIKIGFRDEDNH